MRTVNDQSAELDAPEMQSKGAQCLELEKIQKVMDLYIDGVRNGNVASLQKAFYPQSSIFGWKGKDLYITPIQGLFAYIASTPVPSKTGEPTTFVTTSIQVNGKAANVELAMDSYHGHDFMDFFQLLKVEDRWWIVSKTFHADPHDR
ncbi:hypothetical protein BH24BAC1_BH24BAC1_24570 [soil metagenome]